MSASLPTNATPSTTSTNLKPCVARKRSATCLDVVRKYVPSSCRSFHARAHLYLIPDGPLFYDALSPTHSTEASRMRPAGRPDGSS